MRVLGKVSYGLGIALVIYFCVDGLWTRSRKARARPRVEVPTEAVSRSSLPLFERTASREETREAPAEKQKDPLAEHPDSDNSHELTTVLQAEYASDVAPSRDSLQKQQEIGRFFSSPGLEGKGRLEEVTCRDKICRGVIRIADERFDNEVFSRTFLSTEFMNTVRDAISVVSREKMSDGSVLATFYIHPQSVFGMLSSAQE